MSGDNGAAAPVVIAGFWRRLVAFVIDILLLGLLGVVLGALFQTQFIALGAWGRAVGFVIAMAYFGMSESRWGGGRSPGKRLLRLRVVDGAGALLNTPAAFCRTAIFCFAYFLNGASLGAVPGLAWVSVVQSLVVGMLIISVFYLLLFNRRTRQSIHDLAVGAYVVKANPGELMLPALPVWRGHFAIVGAMMLAVCAGGFVLMQQPTMAGLLATQRALSTLPDAAQISVTANVMTSNEGVLHRLLIGAVVDPSLGDPEALATTMANIALTTYPDAAQEQVIVVALLSGYDIGLASKWRGMNYVQTPAQWRARAAKPRA